MTRSFRGASRPAYQCRCFARLAVLVALLGLSIEAQVIRGAWGDLQGIRPGTKLVVTLMDHSRGRGRFAEVSSEVLTLRRGGRDVTVQRRTALKIDSVSRLRGLGWGVLVGGGTGFVVGAVADIGPNEGGEGALGRVIFSSYGLITGAIAGTVHQKRRTLYRATSLERQSIVSATHSAEGWLEYLDRQDYPQAWLDASDLLRDANDEQSWLARVSTAQRRDGKLIERTPRATQFHKTLPNLAGGPYVTIDFVTKYESRKSTKESLTLVRAEAGWKVARFSEVTLR